jgi:hypothetical protein
MEVDVPGKEMRKAALRRYIVFRIKAIEFLDLNTLRSLLWAQQIDPVPQLRDPRCMSDSLRTVVLSWFALFIDKSKDGMDVTKLWVELFPQHKARVEEAWARMEPAWKTIRNFRDRAGFHADTPLKYFDARFAIHVEKAQVQAAVLEFESLLRFFLEAEEKELPELGVELDRYLNQLRIEHRIKYQREQLKAYMMVRDTDPAA